MASLWEKLTTSRSPSTPGVGDYEGNVAPPVSGPNALVAPRSGSLTSGRLADDIEAKSDFYVPSVYQQLGFYSNFSTNTDGNTSFIPVTQTKANPKLFVVGIIPPSVNITGRLLDRSASVSNILGGLVSPESEPGTFDSRSTVDRIENGVAVAVPDGIRGSALPDSFWQSYVLMCDRLKTDPNALAAVLEKESHFDPKAQNIGKGRTAQGLCQFVRDTAVSDRVKMEPEVWDEFALLSAEEQLVYVERYFQGRSSGKGKDDLNVIVFGGNRNPDGSLYASKVQQENWIRDHPEDAGKFNNPERQALAVESNPKASLDGGLTIRKEGLAKNLAVFPSPSILERIRTAQDYIKRNNISSSGTNATTANATAPNWKAEGSQNASAAKKDIAKTAERDQLRDDLTNRFRQAQLAEIKATISAVEALRNAPPLRLLVNPTSFKISSEKVVSDGNWTRNGPIIEYWGENQDKLDASGKLAGFFSIDAVNPAPDAQGESPGLTRGARQYSASYQNFMSLYLLYRNNANVYTMAKDISDTKEIALNRLSMVGSMYIYYDDTMYIGSFDNFSITESDATPYSLEYNFQFTVRATFLLDRPSANTVDSSNFTSRRMVLPTTTPSVGPEDYSSVPLPPGTVVTQESQIVAASPDPLADLESVNL